MITIVSVEQIADDVFPMLPEMDHNEQKLSLGIFRNLARGNPVSRSELVQDLNIPEETLELFLKNHLGVYYNEVGDIAGYMGLTVLKMSHSFRVNGRQLYTWCAWDSLFIPELLGETAQVESLSPKTKEIIRLTVRPDGIENLDPDGAVMSLILPDLDDEGYQERLQKDIISSFCHHVHFFKSAEVAQEWLGEKNDEYAIITVADGFELGRRMNEFLHGQALADSMKT